MSFYVVCVVMMCLFLLFFFLYNFLICFIYIKKILSVFLFPVVFCLLAFVAVGADVFFWGGLSPPPFFFALSFLIVAFEAINCFYFLHWVYFAFIIRVYFFAYFLLVFFVYSFCYAFIPFNFDFYYFITD